MRLPQLQFQPPVDSSLPGARVEVWEPRVKVCPELLLEAVAAPLQGVGGHKGRHLCQHLQATPFAMMWSHRTQDNQTTVKRHICSGSGQGCTCDKKRLLCVLASPKYASSKGKSQAAQVPHCLVVTLMEHVKLTLHSYELEHD